MTFTSKKGSQITNVSQMGPVTAAKELLGRATATSRMHGVMECVNFVKSQGLGDV